MSYTGDTHGEGQRGCLVRQFSAAFQAIRRSLPVVEKFRKIGVGHQIRVFEPESPLENHQQWVYRMLRISSVLGQHQRNACQVRETRYAEDVKVSAQMSQGIAALL